MGTEWRHQGNVQVQVQETCKEVKGRSGVQRQGHRVKRKVGREKGEG